MANQAIALQARGPQVPDIGAVTSRMVQIRNAMAQQQAAERQAAVAEQELAFKQNKETRDAQAAHLDQLSKVGDFFRNGLASWAGFGNEAAIQALRDEAVRMMPSLDKVIPEARVLATDQNAFNQAYQTADSLANKRFGTAITKEVVTPTGDVYGANISSMPGYTFMAPAPDISKPVMGGNPPAAAAPSTRVGSPVAGAAPAGAPVAAAPTQAADVLAKMPGNLRDIIVNAKETGYIRRDDVQTLAKALGNPGVRMLQNFILDNNIDLLDETPGVKPMSETGPAPLRIGEGIHGEYDAPALRTAEYRSDQGAPAFEPAQYDPNAYGRTRVKPPMESPSQNPASAGAVTGAQTGASEGVRVTTQPKIVAGEERAKRLEKLRGDFPTARQETQTIVDHLAQRINAIDEFLRSPYRRSVIGSIEGRIPRFFQDEERADAQRLWDTITNNDVLQTILAARAQTGTGGSPLSSMSNSDLQFIIGASSPLTQTGSEPKQEQQLLKMRGALYGKLQQAQQTFNDTYREISREAPNIRLNVPRVAPRYSAGPAAGAQRTKGGATVSNW